MKVVRIHGSFNSRKGKLTHRAGSVISWRLTGGITSRWAKTGA